jgi:hypothetical protein
MPDKGIGSKCVIRVDLFIQILHDFLVKFHISFQFFVVEYAEDFFHFSQAVFFHAGELRAGFVGEGKDGAAMVVRIVIPIQKAVFDQTVNELSGGAAADVQLLSDLFDAALLGFGNEMEYETLRGGYMFFIGEGESLGEGLFDDLEAFHYLLDIDKTFRHD